MIKIWVEHYRKLINEERFDTMENLTTFGKEMNREPIGFSVEDVTKSVKNEKNGKPMERHLNFVL